MAPVTASVIACTERTLPAWRAKNGERSAEAHDAQPIAGGDLMTASAFSDFELSFEWKIAPGANSGVKYNVSEAFSLANASNHAALGFEYQVLDDDRHEDGKLPSHRTAALYDMIEPNGSKPLYMPCALRSAFPFLVSKARLSE